MKIVTVISDEENFNFFLLKLSCVINNLEFVPLIAKQKHFSSNRLKDSILRLYLEEIDSDEIILFTDGYDAIFMTNEEEIMSKFKSFGKNLIFSTETNCWPDQYIAAQFPQIGTGPYKYLNSGGFIGKSGLIKELLDKNYISSEKYERSNQHIWSLIFLKNQDIIDLDTKCEIFCTFSPEVGAAHLPVPPDNNNYYDYYLFMRKWFQDHFLIEKSRIFNKITETWPCQVHFNGDSKILLDIEIKNALLEKVSISSRVQNLYVHIEE